MIDKKDPRLTAFVLGELDDVERAAIEAAIENDSDLQGTVQHIRSVCASVTTAFDQELKDGTPTSVVSLPNPEETSSNFRSSRFVLWAAAGSIALLAMSIGWILLGQNEGNNLIGGVGLLSDLDLEKDGWNFHTPTDEAEPASITPLRSHSTLPDLKSPAIPRSGQQITESDFQELTKLIQQTADSDEWTDTTGGEFKAYQPNLSLIVSQDQDGDGSTEFDFPDPAEWEGSARKRKRFADIPMITESLSIYDRRTANLAGQQNAGGGRGDRRIAKPAFGGPDAEFLSGGEVQVLAVETKTFDGSATTQRATDKDLVDDLLNEAGEAVGHLYAYESNGIISSLEQRLRQADISLRVAQQRFGPEHPKVKELRDQLGKFVEANSHLSASAVTIAEVLFKRVNPSGTQEVEIRSADVEKHQLASDLNADRMKGFLETLYESEKSAGALPKNAEIATKLAKAIESIENEKLANHLSRQFAAAANVKLNEAVAKHNRRVRQRRGWRRVEATQNTARLIVGDKDELDLTGMQMQVQVDGFRARVLIDYFYYNDRQQQLEGNFKIRLPDDASLYYFAFGQSAYDFSPDEGMAAGEFIGDGNQYVSLGATDIGLARQDAWQNVKEARMVPREKAAFAYSQTVRRRVDPALVEWSGAGIFNARVFPLAPKQLHRIVVGYDVNLTPVENGMVYRLDLPKQTGQCRVDLSVAEYGTGHWKLQTSGDSDGEDDPAIEWESTDKIRSQKQMRFDSPGWSSLTLAAKNTKPILLYSPDTEKANFFATQFSVDLPKEKVAGESRAVFLVDTSLSSRPEKFNVWLDLLKATLENNRNDLKQFAVMFFDVDTRFWRDEWTDNSPENVSQLLKDCFQIGLEGATNLHGAMLELGEADWLIDGGQKPDLFLLSDGAANWGETNLQLIQNDYVKLNIGSMFAYQTGLNGTAIRNLRYLTGATGGAVFSVASENEVAAASIAHRNKPWKLESMSAGGTQDLMTAGRVQWVYPDQLLTVVGRGKLDAKIELNLSQASTQKRLTVETPVRVESELASRLYGHVSVGQLESLGESVFDVSAAYARHFRITGETCSLLMLESESDYQRFEIKPKEDWFVIQSRDASDIVGDAIAKDSENLMDAKAQFVSWLERLEKMPGLEFEMPTALKIALDGMQFESIDSRLDIEESDKNEWSKKYVESLSAENLDPQMMAAEMDRRRSGSADNALRAYSNLVESNPGNVVVARDVAFTAIDLDRPAAAYHLLRRVIQLRPYEASTYAALGQCLDQLKQADMAIIFYEIALAAKFQNQGTDFHKIAATHYRSLLNRIVRGQLESSAAAYATARLEALERVSPIKESDLVVSMTWNTDQTDVDLHVVEPSGEECSYQNRGTEAGGKITTDKTDGFGPEMYSIDSAPKGKFNILAKFYSSNQNRTKVSNKVYLSIYEKFGTAEERLTRQSITLDKVSSKERVYSVEVK